MEVSVTQRIRTALCSYYQIMLSIALLLKTGLLFNISVFVMQSVVCDLMMKRPLFGNYRFYSLYLLQSIPVQSLLSSIHAIIPTDLVCIYFHDFVIAVLYLLLRQIP